MHKTQSYETYLSIKKSTFHTFVHNTRSITEPRFFLLDFQIKMSGGIERMTCTEEDDEDTHRSDMEVASVFSRGICNVFSGVI